MRYDGSDCDVALAVPYRDRAQHLKAFVVHMEKYLAQTRFKILVIEQADRRPFNRGKLLNIGFSLAKDIAECVCFHDVDMLPVRDCDYNVPPQTTHLAGRVEQFSFRMPYPDYLGGVLLVRQVDFQKVNGFSNNYWGYGQEDDDLWLRFQLADIVVLHRAGIYRSLPHSRAASVPANLTRLAGELRVAALSVRDPIKRRRIELRYYRDPWIQLLPTVDETGCIESESDGLSTLRYEVVRKRSLGELLGSQGTVSDRHEIVSVAL